MLWITTNTFVLFLLKIAYCECFDVIVETLFCCSVLLNSVWYPVLKKNISVTMVLVCVCYDVSAVRRA